MMHQHHILDITSSSNMNRWRVVDDVVMGGRSNGSFEINKEGHGRFFGTVSLENNGGFSSVRHWPDKKIKIEDAKTVVLKIKGDGKSYQFRVKENAQQRYSHIATFETSGKWEEVYIDLTSMYASFRGRKLDIPNFEGEFIEEITFLIANKKNEEFELLIDHISLQ